VLLEPRPTFASPVRVRAVHGPAASNLDEWCALHATTSFAWATTSDDLGDADLIVLPGSKLVAADLPAPWQALRRLAVDGYEIRSQRRPTSSTNTSTSNNCLASAVPLTGMDP
jgi:cobyric acid synthase